MSLKEKWTNGPEQKPVKDYLIMYQVKPEILFVPALFDTRQDPGKLPGLAT